MLGCIVTFVTDDLTDQDTVLLLYMGVVVLLVGAAARELQVVCLGKPQDMVIQEF